MSSLSNMYVVEGFNSAKKDGIYLKKKKLYIIIAILIGLFIAGLIIVYISAKPSATDIAKKCPTTRAPVYTTALAHFPSTPPPIDLNRECSAAICQSPTKALEWLLKCTGAGNATSTTNRTRQQIDYRLPSNLVPYLYDLTIKPFFNVTEPPQFYHGYEKILIKCTKSTNKFMIHMLENLVIDKPSFEITSLNVTQFIPIKNLDSRYFIDKVYYDTRRQYLVVEFVRDIFVEGHHYQVSFGFRGSLKDDNRGFYKSVYTDAAGQKRWLVTSQMEPTHARKSFPCFDEPDLKARFKIRVIHDASLHSLSNMPILSSGPVGDAQELRLPGNTGLGSYNWKQTEFYETVSMSTYLVALIVSDFACVSGVANTELSKRVDVNVCSRPDAVDQLAYALNVAIKLTEFFESYYKVEYPLPKLDHVAIPDFKSGAMENWGLITYREAVLLYDPKKTSQSAEQYIVEVVAHEIAHQWFGNLVSPKWWNDLWLNEGFARYMQFVGTHAVRPEWNMNDQIMSDVFFPIMHLDSVGSSHSISVDVNNPDEINEIFDGITYGKGGSVIRMMNYFLSESVFTNGLSEYLTKYQYAGAVQENLWDSLQQRANFECKIKGIDLTSAMNSWTKQMGHPLVQVKQLNRTHIAINQSHFLLDPSVKLERSNFSYKWYVPFTYSIETLGSSLISNTSARSFDKSNINDHVVWLLPNENQKIIKLPRELNQNSFILANLDGFGFFRVNYDEHNWNMILEQLSRNRQTIPTRMRAQIVNDLFSLSQANKVRPTKPFELVRHMVNENEYIPWSALLDRLSFYVDIIESTEVYGNLREYLIEVIKPIYSRLTWDDKPTDSWLTSRLRTSVIRFACARAHEDCINKARALYAEWMKTPQENKIPKNYRSFVYCAAINNGGWPEWQFASQQYDLEKDSVSRRSLQYGMSCSKETWIQTRFLNDQLNKTKVRAQDSVYGLHYALGHLFSSSMAWGFVKSNWNLLAERFGRDIAYLIRGYSYKVTNTQQYIDFTDFIEGTPTGSTMREYRIACERIEATIKWKNRNYEEVKNWLVGQQSLSPSVDSKKKIDYRLPTNLKPFEYELILKPYIGTENVYGNRSFTFDGQVSIMFKCVQPTSRIVMHELNLIIKRVRLGTQRTELQEITMSRIEHDHEREFLIINLDSSCVRNTDYLVLIDYTGFLTDSLAGFYRSSYLDQNRTLNYLAVTQFEPTDARRAFPCFDEPALKARFNISIIRHEKLFSMSLSNMPLSKTIPTDDREWVIDQFGMSVPMSTYLVAFVVCNYKSIKRNTTKYNIQIEVAARPEAIDNGHGDYGLNEAASIIDFFSDYFDNIYPLPKSTQIAIPDFNAGAMENWGLITYREKYILFNPNYDSILNKKWVSVVVAHELAHQWFGNLVSPIWWNDLWLNEGFASWVEYLGTNHTHPEWRDLEYFFFHQLDAMKKDSLGTSHPISTEVHNPAEIGSLFDAISYEKGASIIRMMNSFLTLETFRKGINVYLKKYQMSNAQQDDLWQELDAQARRDEKLPANLRLKTIMDTWTLQKGYPVVHVQRTPNYFSRSITLKLTQNWFRLDRPANHTEYQEWFIPFTFTVQSRPNFSFEQSAFWMRPNASEEQRTITLPYMDSDVSRQWVLGNMNHAGFYRVNYDTQNWQLLIEQLNSNHELIDVVNRATLIDDAFNLAKAEYVDQTMFLSLISYLKNETDALPFELVGESLAYFATMLSQNYTTFGVFKDFRKSLYKRSYERLGWNESITDITSIYLQLEAIRVMCAYGNEDCISKSREYYNLWINQNQTIPNNVRRLVIQTVVKYGTETDWFFLLEKAKSMSINAERMLILRSLTMSNDFNLLKILLHKSWDRNLVKLQDQPTLIADISGNPIARGLVWDFIVEHWERILSTFGAYSFTLDRLISNVLSSYNTNFELAKVENFFKLNGEKMNSAIYDAFKEGILKIRTNVRWMDRNFNAVDEWLVNFFKFNSP